MSKTNPAQTRASRAKPFKRQGDWPHSGGSFVRQSGGGLKKAEATEPADPATTDAATTNAGLAASKDSGK